MVEGGKYCSFKVGELLFGIDVQDVQEVLRYQEITRVPLAPPVVRGLINLRGQIVTAVDMRRQLNMEDRPAGVMPMNVIVRTREDPISLLVDEIGDVIEVDPEGFEDIPPTVSGVVRELMSGVHKLSDSLLLVLKTERAVSIC
ncbi:MAG: chemotaxis protein CheW [Actinomycetota bacterium]|nr:chemotaxis protein CheW [Actinomycetota bacterium]